MKKLMFALILVLGACSDDPDPDPTAVDGAVDATSSIDADSRCAACGADQVCVQYLGGTCQEISVVCEDRAAGCTGTDCATCNAGHCEANPGQTYTCSAPSCEGEIPEALHCYGP